MAEKPELQKPDYKIIWAALMSAENSSARAAKKAREDGKDEIAQAIDKQTLEIQQVKSKVQMLQFSKQ